MRCWKCVIVGRYKKLQTWTTLGDLLWYCVVSITADIFRSHLFDYLPGDISATGKMSVQYIVEGLLIQE